MSVPSPDGSPLVRGPRWKWWVCGLLLLATMLNYMDRLTLNLMSVRIMEDFRLDDWDYGQLESAFAYAFALGAIVFGWMVDRWNVRWIYPAAVLAWSAAGFVTGLAHGFAALLACRFLLGFAEAGNWPASLRTTQRILPPAQRALGNSILQSGASIGAILTPLIVLVFVTWQDEGQPVHQPGLWRFPFMVIGALGLTWVVLWLMSVRREDLAVTRTGAPSLVNVLGWLVGLLVVDTGAKLLLPKAVEGGLVAAPVAALVTLAVKVIVSALGIAGVYLWLANATRDDPGVDRGLFLRRFWVLVVLVVTINIAWHYFRAWLPLFLQKQHGYSENFAFWFILTYYVATDVGAMAAGSAALFLSHRGISVHTSRVLVFALCAMLTTLSVGAAVLPNGVVLLAVLLVIGFAALGLFPIYYSLSQELTVRHQGKLTGSLGCINWLAMSVLHELAGDSIKRTGSYSLGVALAGLAPVVGVAALVVLWGRTARPQAEPLPASVQKA
jgi:ACS family hexuronate transporter-like MFS transporter